MLLRHLVYIQLLVLTGLVVIMVLSAFAPTLVRASPEPKVIKKFYPKDGALEELRRFWAATQSTWRICSIVIHFPPIPCFIHRVHPELHVFKEGTLVACFVYIEVPSLLSKCSDLLGKISSCCSLRLKLLARCCYITVDSTITALKTVLAHFGAFPNKYTIKYPFHTKATWKVWTFMKTTSLCSVWKNNLFDNIMLAQNHAWHIIQSGWNNILVKATIKEQHHSVTCSV